MSDIGKIALVNLGVGHSGNLLLVVERLTIARGEVVAIVGPSGCGKSTLLSTAAGLLPRIAGEIYFDDQPRAAAWLAANVVRTLQSFPLLPWLTVEGNLLLAARLRNRVIKDARTHLQEFGAAGLAERFPNTLSGGERCRASIAQSLVFDPQLLLLDEPFNGLDIVAKQQVAEGVFRQVRDRGLAAAYVTHDVSDAVYYSDRVVCLTPGRPSRIGFEIDSQAADAIGQVFRFLGGKQHVAA